MSTTAKPISSYFIWRRVHSLMGLWIVIYLIEHLTVNSQAALWLGDNGIGFIRLVNLIQSIPYLQVIEAVLIGIPLLVHGAWGIKRAFSAHTNSQKDHGKAPALQYGRNYFFTLQRFTAWILLVGIIGHVIQMRFIEKPKETFIHGEKEYFTKISFDKGLYTLSKRLNVQLFDEYEIEKLTFKDASAFFPLKERFNPEEEKIFQEEQKDKEKDLWIKTISSFCLKPTEVVAVSKDPGTALLLMVRDTFKNPIYAGLYSLFVLAAAFHAFHGVWTFLITWGILLSYRSQKSMIPFSVIGMILLSCLGLISIWGSYWLNLYR